MQDFRQLAKRILAPRGPWGLGDGFWLRDDATKTCRELPLEEIGETSNGYAPKRTPERHRGAGLAYDRGGALHMDAPRTAA